MRILVFDDNETHRAAARAQLKNHDLTVVGTYDEAQKLLVPNLDKEWGGGWMDERMEKTLHGQFGDPYMRIAGEDLASFRARQAQYFAAAKVMVYADATANSRFDVVLTDLLVPASSYEQGSKGWAFIGKEMPVGIFIGLLAAVRARVKYVAVFTDSSHHDNPASACFDAINYPGQESNPTAFTVEGTKVLLSNTRAWINTFDPQDLARPLQYKEEAGRTDTVRAKNWRVLLDYLIAV